MVGGRLNGAGTVKPRPPRRVLGRKDRDASRNLLYRPLVEAGDVAALLSLAFLMP